MRSPQEIKDLLTRIDCIEEDEGELDPELQAVADALLWVGGGDRDRLEQYFPTEAD